MRRNKVVDSYFSPDNPTITLCDGLIVAKRFKKIGTFYLYVNEFDMVLGTSRRLFPDLAEKLNTKIYRIFWDREEGKMVSEIIVDNCEKSGS